MHDEIQNEILAGEDLSIYSPAWRVHCVVVCRGEHWRQLHPPCSSITWCQLVSSCQAASLQLQTSRPNPQFIRFIRSVAQTSDWLMDFTQYITTNYNNHVFDSSQRNIEPVSTSMTRSYLDQTCNIICFPTESDCVAELFLLMLSGPIPRSSTMTTDGLKSSSVSHRWTSLGSDWASSDI